MDNAIQNMLKKYSLSTIDDYKAAIKEILQEVALLGLSRSGFFNKAAFYGGTALRIFHHLDRFSEDLDFSLIKPDPNINIQTFLDKVADELGAFGFDMQIQEKVKENPSPIKSAFLKGGTMVLLLGVNSISPPLEGVNPKEKITIKIEIDTDPPKGAGYQILYLLNPIPYYVRLFDLPSLFAGKIHALLCRKWKKRIKGRDYYDYVWYLSKEIPVNLIHLQNRMIQTGDLDNDIELDHQSLVNLLKTRFNDINFTETKKDVLPFIRTPESLDLWSTDFFTSITNNRLKAVKN